MLGLHRPPPMIEDENPFLQDMFRHMSSIFEPKSSRATRDIALLSRQASLCTIVLESWVLLVRRQPLSSATMQARTRPPFQCLSRC
jgi:hypothetical protein